MARSFSLLFLVCVLSWACDDDGGSTGPMLAADASTGQGGMTMEGASAMGGDSATGGAPEMDRDGTVGGNPGMGGAPEMGGALAMGGGLPIGGDPDSGGQEAMAGAPAVGGQPTPGGAQPAGGIEAMGGSGGEPMAGGETGAGGAASEGALPLGEAVLLEPCPGVANCRELAIRCPEQPDAVVQIKVSRPEGALRGTVVVGTGGTGEAFYDPAVVAGLVERGFRVVDRAWTTPWEEGNHGTAATACRYATLVTWIRQRWADGPLCVTGNSGGSAEVSYALTHYGREVVLDLVVPTSGPPMARFDLACVGGDDWAQLCMSVLPEDHCPVRREHICDYTQAARQIVDMGLEGQPCGRRQADRAEELREASVLALEADLDYTTPVHFVFGHRDCTTAVPHGLLYRDAIISPTETTWVNASHPLYREAEGQAAIVDILADHCVSRP